MARPKLTVLVPAVIQMFEGEVGSVTTPHTDECTAAIGHFNKFRRELELQLASIAQSAGVIKGDDVVDDDACDAVVTCCQNIANAWNEYMKANKVKDNIEAPADLEPSPYQDSYQDSDE